MVCGIMSEQPTMAAKTQWVEAMNRGSTAFARNEFQLAEQWFAAAVAAWPQNGDGHFWLGNAQRAGGSPQAATVSYERAIQLRPDFAAAMLNLANIHFNTRGQLDEAVRIYRQLIAMRPDYAEAYNNLGNALQLQAELSEAIECFRNAMELDPTGPSCSNYLLALHYDPRRRPALPAGAALRERSLARSPAADRIRLAGFSRASGRALCRTDHLQP
jgi:tetratricopeptide (TPR) repeat protein